MALTELFSLDGTNGFKLSGEPTDERSGFSVSAAGDVNGDGFGDVVIGAPTADPNGSWSGASYVVFGRASGFSANLELSALDGTDGFKLSGETHNDRAGISVSAAGDVNGDGFGDLVIGAPGVNPNTDFSGTTMWCSERPRASARISNSRPSTARWASSSPESTPQAGRYPTREM
jgi:hypothetical protein